MIRFVSAETTSAATAGLEPLLLDTQYRMHPMIAQVPSQLFYQGRLKSGAILTTLVTSVSAQCMVTCERLLAQPSGTTNSADWQRSCVCAPPLTCQPLLPEYGTPQHVAFVVQNPALAVCPRNNEQQIICTVCTATLMDIEST